MQEKYLYEPKNCIIGYRHYTFEIWSTFQICIKKNNRGRIEKEKLSQELIIVQHFLNLEIDFYA